MCSSLQFEIIKLIRWTKKRTGSNCAWLLSNPVPFPMSKTSAVRVLTKYHSYEFHELFEISFTIGRNKGKSLFAKSHLQWGRDRLFRRANYIIKILIPWRWNKYLLLHKDFRIFILYYQCSYNLFSSLCALLIPVFSVRLGEIDETRKGIWNKYYFSVSHTHNM